MLPAQFIEQDKSNYHRTLDLQFQLKDASKRLAMAGLLQALQAIHKFMQSVYLQEPLGGDQQPGEGAPFETKEHRDQRMK